MIPYFIKGYFIQQKSKQCYLLSIVQKSHISCLTLKEDLFISSVTKATKSHTKRCLQWEQKCNLTRQQYSTRKLTRCDNVLWSSSNRETVKTKESPCKSLVKKQISSKSWQFHSKWPPSAKDKQMMNEMVQFLRLSRQIISRKEPKKYPTGWLKLIKA